MRQSRDRPKVPTLALRRTMSSTCSRTRHSGASRSDGAWARFTLEAVLPPEPPPQQPPLKARAKGGAAMVFGAAAGAKAAAKTMATAVLAIGVCRGSVATSAFEDEDDKAAARCSPSIALAYAQKQLPLRRRSSSGRAAAAAQRMRQRRCGAYDERGGPNGPSPAAPGLEATMEPVLEELERSRMLLEDRPFRGGLAAGSSPSSQRSVDQATASSVATAMQQPAPSDVPTPGPKLAEQNPNSASMLTYEEQEEKEEELKETLTPPTLSCRSTPTFSGDSPGSTVDTGSCENEAPSLNTELALPEPSQLPWTVLGSPQHQCAALPGALPRSPAGLQEPRGFNEAQQLLAEMLDGGGAGGSGYVRRARPPSTGRGDRSESRGSLKKARSGGGGRRTNSAPGASAHRPRQRVPPEPPPERQEEPSRKPVPPLEPLNGRMPDFPPAACGNPEQRIPLAAMAAAAAAAASPAPSPARPRLAEAIGGRCAQADLVAGGPAMPATPEPPPEVLRLVEWLSASKVGPDTPAAEQENAAHESPFEGALSHADSAVGGASLEVADPAPKEQAKLAMLRRLRRISEEARGSPTPAFVDTLIGPSLSAQSLDV